MKPLFRKAIVSLLIAGWGLMAFHTHKPHLTDLHPSHEACQLCAHASNLYQAALPSDPSRLSAASGIPETVCDQPQIFTAAKFPTSKKSRAPPR